MPPGIVVDCVNLSGSWTACLLARIVGLQIRLRFSAICDFTLLSSVGGPRSCSTIDVGHSRPGMGMPDSITYGNGSNGLLSSNRISSLHHTARRPLGC